MVSQREHLPYRRLSEHTSKITITNTTAAAVESLTIGGDAAELADVSSSFAFAFNDSGAEELRIFGGFLFPDAAKRIADNDAFVATI